MPATTNTVGRVRNVGSNYTTFQWNGKNIAFLERVVDSGQTNVGGHQFIHPLGYDHPVDHVVGRALGGGTLTLTIRELWNQEIWQQFPGLTGANTLTEIFRYLADQAQYVTCVKIIKPPQGPLYGTVYHRCLITQIADGDEIFIGALSVPKTMTVAYTHKTRL